MVHQLANNSTRLLRAMAKDVLIKIGEFIFFVDFVVLEIEVIVCPENEKLIILGHPFLDTCNSLITCKFGKMKLTFRNMTIELNVFYKYDP